MNANVTVQSTDPQTKKTVYTQYASPLYNNVANQRQLLPGLFTYFTVTDPAQTPEIPSRININTAPQEILNSLQYVGSNAAASSATASTASATAGSSTGATSSTGLAVTDVSNMIQLREQMTGLPGDIYATPTWLLTEAKITPTVLQQLDPYITTHAQVFRVQSVGYFDGGKGPAARIEAIIDTNAGRPRIIAWRNLSDLGNGIDPNAMNGANGPNGASSPNMNSNP